MYFLAIVFLIAFSCKKVSPSQLATVANQQNFQLQAQYHAYLKLTANQVYFESLIDLEREIRSYLKKNYLADQDRSTLAKMQHHLRSFIAVSKASNCLVRNTKYGYYTLKDNDMCAIFVRSLANLNYELIQDKQTNEQFYHQVLAGNYDKFFVDNISTYSPQERREYFHNVSDKNIKDFSRSIQKNIREITLESMGKYQRLLPFAFTKSWYQLCKDKSPNHCQQLQQLSVDHQLIQHNLVSVTSLLRNYLVQLNKIRNDLNLLLDKKNPIKKENFFIVPLFNVIDGESPELIVLQERYQLVLLDSSRELMLPLLLDLYGKSLYLDNKFVGLVNYKPLAYRSQARVESSIDKLKTSLLNNWLRIQQHQKLSEGDIYRWMIHNEIAIARLLLQAPQYSVVVGHLLNKYQDQANAPRWLQLSKSITHRFDIGFIPICIVGGILFPVAAPALAVIATTANLFWVGTATADAIVSRSRYLSVERALLNGSSQQLDTGLKLLRESQEKFAQALVSGTVGTALSVAGIQMIGKGLDRGFKFMATDFNAAVWSEIFAGQDLDLLGNFEGASDRQRLSPARKNP